MFRSIALAAVLITSLTTASWARAQRIIGTGEASLCGGSADCVLPGDGRNGGKGGGAPVPGDGQNGGNDGG